MFFAERPEGSRCVLEIDLEFLHMCSESLCRLVVGKFFVFVFAGNLGSLEAQIFQKQTSTIHLAEKIDQ